MNALINAEAAKEYQSTIADDCKSISDAREEQIFDDLICGRTIAHYGEYSNLALFSYENIFDFFLIDADETEFNSVGQAVQELRETLNEVDGIADTDAGFKRLQRKVKALTDVIDTKAKTHINENYERICEYQDSGIGHAA